jgi:hypothetical protein
MPTAQGIKSQAEFGQAVEQIVRETSRARVLIDRLEQATPRKAFEGNCAVSGKD